VRVVVAKTMKEVKHSHVTPLPSKIDEREWEATETWYTCTMKTPEIGQVRALLMEGSDRQAADLLVTQGTLFWAPAWPKWLAASPTSKVGWWVRATGVRMEKKQIILEIPTVQRDEFHRLGDIRVDGPVNIKEGEAWRLRQVIRATVPAMAVLAEIELERNTGGFRRCEALQTFQDREPKGETERSEDRREAPIQRPRVEKVEELPVIDFKVDWKALQQRLDTGQEKGNLKGVLCKKGQAHQMDAEKKKMTGIEKRSIRKGRPREAKIFDKTVIDETGWELLKLWHRKEAVLQWDRAWERTTTWESAGGRTLDWTITSELRSSRELKLMVRAHTLTL
jgi:hypothetical protein